MKGKNFSANNSSGKRKESDFYETPYSLTRLFLGAENPEGTVLEPACGGGAIVRILEEFGIVPTAYDKETDFMSETGYFDWVITNPPFSNALTFIKKAKTVSSSFAFLLPLSYLHGKQRLDEVYSDREFPLSTVYVFSRYPLLGDELREDGKHRTGMMVYAWFVWKKGYKGCPEIKWLDNHSYVIGARNLTPKYSRVAA